jgi:hypothetical protein
MSELDNNKRSLRMAEKYETHSADVVEQTKQLFVENLRGRRWRPVKELEALIPDALAEARLATVNPLATAGQADPKSYGRLRLRMDAVKALEDSAVCEVRGAEGKEEIRLVAQDGAPEMAARQAATATTSEKSGTKAAQPAPQLDVRSRGEGAGAPAANNKSATPNDTTTDDEAAATDVRADVGNAVTTDEPADNKAADDDVPEPSLQPVTKPSPASNATGTTSRSRTMTTKRNAPQQATEAPEEAVPADAGPAEAAPDTPASEHDAEPPNGGHPVATEESAAETANRPSRRTDKSKAGRRAPANRPSRRTDKSKAGKSKAGRRAPTSPADSPPKGDPVPGPDDGELCEVPIDELVIDPKLQCRETMINEDTVEEYLQAMKRGDEFPPLLAVRAGKQLLLVEGRHRLEAARRLGLKKVKVLVISGTREDAIWLAAAANKDHGLRRTNADKERAVKTALAQPRAKGLSDREIAKHVSVSHQMVSDYRKEGRGEQGLSKSDSEAARTVNQKSTQPAPGQQRPTESAETAPRTRQSPAVPHDKAKEPAAAADQPAGAASPEDDEPRNGTPERKDEQRPAASGGEEGPREDPPSSAETCDSYEAVYQELQSSRKPLEAHEMSFPELVQLLDEEQRESLRGLVDDISYLANRWITALDDPKLWRVEDEELP